MDNSGNKTQLDGYITVGKIINSFGNRGQVKIEPLTDFPERFFSREDLFLLLPSSPEPVKVTISNPFAHKNLIIADISCCESPEDVKKIMNSEIKIKKEQVKKLEKNSYYVFDIIGLEVYDEGGAYLGQVKDIITNAANDIYVVAKPDKKELLVPAIGRYIQKVDIENKKIIITEPEYTE